MNFEPIRMDIPKDIGKIEAFMRTTAPEGYLICDGSSYSTSDYPLLVNLFIQEFGTAYKFGGSGSTFKVPDLRGEFLRGTGTNGHTNQGSGSAVGTHQDATLINPGWVNNLAAGWSLPRAPSATYSDLVTINNADSSVNIGTRQSISADTDLACHAETADGTWLRGVRPTNSSVLYCIKAY